MKTLFIVCTLGLLFSACTWVKPTAEGEKARVLSLDEVGSCTKSGKTTVSVKSSIAGVDRNAEKIQHELEMLARNSAVDLKGDTVVPIGKPVDGKQVFEVYRCIK